MANVEFCLKLNISNIEFYVYFYIKFIKFYSKFSKKKKSGKILIKLDIVNVKVLPRT